MAGSRRPEGPFQWLPLMPIDYCRLPFSATRREQGSRRAEPAFMNLEDCHEELAQASRGA
jgi:hypothetical protein